MSSYKDMVRHGTVTRINKVVSEFNSSGLTDLRSRIQDLLAGLCSKNHNAFSYAYPALQPVRYIGFNITRGTIPSDDFDVIKEEFPGSKTVAGPDRGTTVLLVPKSCAEDLDSDGDEGGEGDSLTRGNKMRRIKLYIELVAYTVLLVGTLFLYMRYVGMEILDLPSPPWFGGNKTEN